MHVCLMCRLVGMYQSTYIERLRVIADDANAEPPSSVSISLYVFPVPHQALAGRKGYMGLPQFRCGCCIPPVQLRSARILALEPLQRF